jgi:hypothetical protein
MGTKRNAGAAPVIRRRLTEKWTGLRAAARVLGVSDTQVRRHVTGEQPSRRLAKRMAEHGISVEGGAA